MSRAARSLFAIVPARLRSLSGDYEEAFESQLEAVRVATERSYERPGVLALFEDGDEEPTWLFEGGIMRGPHEPPPVRTDARDLRIVNSDEATRLVQATLGPLVGGGSLVVDRYLERDDLREWRIEAGNWLATAQRAGFLDALLRKNLKAIRHAALDTGSKGKDPGFFRLRSVLAEPMTAHYLVGCGWAFVEHEPRAHNERPHPDGGPGKVDIDLIMRSPSGIEVRLQVKASGRPGDIEGGRIVNGEISEELFGELDKAISRQLPRTNDAPGVVVLSAQWRISPLMDVSRYLYGSTSSHGDGRVLIGFEDRGRFFRDCSHVGAVMLLEHQYGGAPPGYACQVLLNPVAAPAVRCAAEWFPHARVCFESDGALRWSPNAPARHHLPDGTDIHELLARSDGDGVG